MPVGPGPIPFNPFRNNNSISVTEMENVGDGRDATRAFRLACLAAAKSSNQIGEIIVPAGLYTITATTPKPAGVTFGGLSYPAGGINDQGGPSSTILKAFNGDAFTTVIDTSNYPFFNSGGGYRNLRIVQIFGTPASTGGVGSAISWLASGNSIRPAWEFAENIVVEEFFGTYAPWTWGVNIDSLGFSGNGAIDIFLYNIKTHVSSTIQDPPIGGMLRVSGGNNVQCTTLQGSQNGAISLGPTLGANFLAAGTYMLGCLSQQLYINNATAVQVTGGTFGGNGVTDAIKLTTNVPSGASGNRVSLMPSALVGTFTDLSPAGTCGLWYYDSVAGNWVSNQPIAVNGTRITVP